MCGLFLRPLLVTCRNPGSSRCDGERVSLKLMQGRNRDKHVVRRPPSMNDGPMKKSRRVPPPARGFHTGGRRRDVPVCRQKERLPVLKNRQVGRDTGPLETASPDNAV